jgi:hypothetical protein
VPVAPDPIVVNVYATSSSARSRASMCSAFSRVYYRLDPSGDSNVSGDTPVRAAKEMLKKHTSSTDDEIAEMVEAAAEMRRELMAELKAEAQKE